MRHGHTHTHAYMHVCVYKEDKYQALTVCFNLCFFLSREHPLFSNTCTICILHLHALCSSLTRFCLHYLFCSSFSHPYRNSHTPSISIFFSVIPAHTYIFRCLFLLACSPFVICSPFIVLSREMLFSRQICLKGAECL